MKKYNDVTIQTKYGNQTEDQKGDKAVTLQNILCTQMTALPAATAEKYAAV